MRKLLLLLILLPAIAFAEQKTTTLFFPGVTDVQQASGLIFKDDQTIQTAAKWRLDSSRGGTFVTVTLPQQGIDGASLVSGAIISSNDGLVLGPLTFANLHDPRALVPICEDITVPAIIAEERKPILTSLVEIRLRRIQLIKKKLQNAATPEFIQRLQKLETGFGFTYKEALSTALPPEELAARLDVLFHAINRYKYFRNKQ